MQLPSAIVQRRHTAGHLVLDVLSNWTRFFDEKVMVLLFITKIKFMSSTSFERGRLFIQLLIPENGAKSIIFKDCYIDGLQPKATVFSNACGGVWKILGRERSKWAAQLKKDLYSALFFSRGPTKKLMWKLKQVMWSESWLQKNRTATCWRLVLKKLHVNIVFPEKGQCSIVNYANRVALECAELTLTKIIIISANNYWWTLAGNIPWLNVKAHTSLRSFWCLDAHGSQCKSSLRVLYSSPSPLKVMKFNMEPNLNRSF